MSSPPYFLLDGAYNGADLQNSPNPIQDIKYPCLVSYPFLSNFSHETIDNTSLSTNYQNMNNTYQVKPCPYCKYYNQGT